MNGFIVYQEIISSPFHYLKLCSITNEILIFCNFLFFPPFRPKNEDPLANRTILYQMVALYDYNSQGPEDLEFSEGDTIDILSEGM